MSCNNPTCPVCAECNSVRASLWEYIQYCRDTPSTNLPEDVRERMDYQKFEVEQLHDQCLDLELIK